MVSEVPLINVSYSHSNKRCLVPVRRVSFCWSANVSSNKTLKKKKTIPERDIMTEIDHLLTALVRSRWLVIIWLQ